MKLKLIAILGLAYLGITSVMAVIAPVAPYVEPIVPVKLTIDEKIDLVAAKYKVSPSLMKKVIYCESSYNPKAVGDGGTSFGLSQIHLPAHPEVTKEQAFDEDFAINFMGESFSKNKHRMWSCWRIVTNQ